MGLSVTPPDRGQHLGLWESGHRREYTHSCLFFEILHVPNKGHFSVKSPEGKGTKLQAEYKVTNWRKSNNITSNE